MFGDVRQRFGDDEVGGEFDLIRQPLLHLTEDGDRYGRT